MKYLLWPAKKKEKQLFGYFSDVLNVLLKNPYKGNCIKKIKGSYIGVDLMLGWTQKDKCSCLTLSCDFWQDIDTLCLCFVVGNKLGYFPNSAPLEFIKLMVTV